MIMNKKKYKFGILAAVLIIVALSTFIYSTNQKNAKENALPIEQADCWYNELEAGKEYRLCEYESPTEENDQNQMLFRLPNGNYYVAEKGKADKKATEIALGRVAELKAKRDIDKTTDIVPTIRELNELTNKTVVLVENATYIFIYEGETAHLTPVCERPNENVTGCAAGKMQEYITKHGYDNPAKYILLR
jgi:hypothetical protein